MAVVELTDEQIAEAKKGAVLELWVNVGFGVPDIVKVVRVSEQEVETIIAEYAQKYAEAGQAG